MWYRTFVSALILSMFLTVSASAAKPTRAERRRAKVLFRQGQTHYQVGEFSKALERFTAALKLVKRPSIILNIAQCHRQLKNTEKALFFYKLHLTEWERQNPGKPSPYSAEVQGYITQIEADLERARVEQRAREEEERLRREEEAARQAEAERQQRMTVVLEGQEPRTEPPAPFYKRWWFWTAVGVVVAGAATATAIALQPESASVVNGTVPDGPITVE